MNARRKTERVFRTAPSETPDLGELLHAPLDDEYAAATAGTSTANAPEATGAKFEVWRPRERPALRAAAAGEPPGDRGRTRVVGLVKGLGKAGLWPAGVAVDAYEALTDDTRRAGKAREFLGRLRTHIDTAPTWEPDALAGAGEIVGQVGGSLGVAGAAGRYWPLMAAPSEALADRQRTRDMELLATDDARARYYGGNPPPGRGYFAEMLNGAAAGSNEDEPRFDPLGESPSWRVAAAAGEAAAAALGAAPYTIADLFGRFVVGAAKRRLLRQDAGGGDARFSASRGMFATDEVPRTIFGIPVVADEGAYTESDLEFFRKHPEAGGFYDMGDGEDVEDGSPEGAPVQDDSPPARGKYGLRPDGTPKGGGWLGPMTNALGQAVTEYSMQSDAVKLNGARVDFPMLVPTLTRKELDAVLADSAKMSYDAKVFAAARQKAVDFAKDRIAHGLGVWAPETDARAVKFMEDNPTLFDHVKGFEKLRTEPYRDIGGWAIAYGAHMDADGNPVTDKTRVSEYMAVQMLARDLYARREKLKAAIPNWKLLSAGARQALLDVSMGADDVLSETKSKGLFTDLRSTKDPALLNEYVKNHYYSYRNPNDADTREGLEARRIAGGKLFFDDTFSYKGKTWDADKRKFVVVENGAK